MNRQSFSRLRAQAVAAALVVPALVLTGCAMGTLNLSGPSTAATTVAVHLTGRAMGGQQPVEFATVRLWAVGTTGYGSAATELTNTLSTASNEYYPGGSPGCDSNSVIVTSLIATGTMATFTAANTLEVGELVQIADTGSAISGSTLAVVTATPGTFTVADTSDGTGASGPDSGTASPICYTAPTTDINGNFVLTGDYTVPGTAAQTYITVSGGNPGLTPITTTNTAIKLAAPLGLSSGLSSSSTIIVNELTTTAMAFSAGQFFTPTYGSTSTDSFGSSSTNALGLTNALATAGNLVQVSSGQPWTGNQVLTGAPGSVTVTPEFAKFTTIGDILAACVNSTGPSSTACSELFADSTPTDAPGTTTAATVASDTLQAAVYLSLNPTSTNASSSSTNMTQLFGLADSNSPFASFHSGYAQPTDWTLGITYGSNSTVNSAYFITYPSYLAVDGYGNVWIVNDASGTVATSNSISEISPTGTPMAQVYVGGITGPSDIVIDPSENVWVPGYGSSTVLGNTVYEYTAGGATKSFTTDTGPQRLVSDGSGNIFADLPAYKAAGELQEITTSGAVNTVGTGLVTDFTNVAADSKGNVYVTAGGASGTASSGLTTTGNYPDYYVCTTASCSAVTDNAAVTEGEVAVATGPSDSLYIQNYGTATMASTPYNSTTGTSVTLPASIKAEFMAVDGAGNLWFSNYVSKLGSVVETTAAGAALSPATGFAHSYYGSYDIALDGSGNVWVGNYSQGSSATLQSYVTEIVGAAAPTITPRAAQIPSTGNKVATLP